jgi:hypothetical protein
MTQFQTIGGIIKDTVDNIDRELKEIADKGIFFAPELHIAFECGQKIFNDRDKIWRDCQYDWKRETKYENYGLADLVFEPRDKANKEYVIEFKVLQTLDQYLRDIEKLKKLPTEKYERFFCAILGFFKNQEGQHINELKKYDGLELISASNAQQTWQMNYKENLFYSTTIWKLN